MSQYDSFEVKDLYSFSPPTYRSPTKDDWYDFLGLLWLGLTEPSQTEYVHIRATPE